MARQEEIQKILSRLLRQDSFSKQDLRDIWGMCVELPVGEQLAPLAGIAFISNRPLSEKEIEYGLKLAKKNSLLGEAK